jgi:hypothetical protein
MAAATAEVTAGADAAAVEAAAEEIEESSGFKPET